MIKRLVFGLAVLLVSSALVAEEKKVADLFVLGKVGMMEVDINDANPLYSLGFIVGKGLGKDLTAELEFDYGFFDGEFKNGGEKGEIDIWTLAGFLVYRLPLASSLYVKLKGGILHEDISVSKGQGKSSSDTDVSGGIGAGYVVDDLMGKRVTFELDYTQVEQDISATYLAVHINF